MDAWNASWAPGLAVAMVAAGLAGCSGPNAHEGTLTALEALARARERFPDLELFSLHGLEGARPGPESEYLGLQDDGRDDGALGDGRLSSWAVSFVAEDKDSLLEVRVSADEGNPPQLRSHAVPLSAEDEQIAWRADPDVVDSAEAASAVASDPTFKTQVAGSPGSGFLYSFSRHGVDYAAHGEETPDIDLLGWPVGNGTWRILHFGADGGQPLAMATVLGNGTVGQVDIDTPRHLAVLADNAIAVPDPIPPPTTPIVHHFEFAVPVQAQELVGDAYVPSVVDGEYNVRVLAPDGTVLFDSDSPGADVGHFMVFQPAPGQWTVEARHAIPVPMPTILVLGPRQLQVHVEAEVPLLL